MEEYIISNSNTYWAKTIHVPIYSNILSGAGWAPIPNTFSILVLFPPILISTQKHTARCLKIAGNCSKFASNV